MAKRATHFYRLRSVVDDLAPLGKALSLLGPLAPPCLAVPYVHMRLMVIEAFEQAWAEFTMDDTEEQLQADTFSLAPIIAAVANLPDLTDMWRNAPDQWRTSPIIPGRLIPVLEPLHVEGRGVGRIRGLRGPDDLDDPARNAKAKRDLSDIRARMFGANQAMFIGEQQMLTRGIATQGEEISWGEAAWSTGKVVTGAVVGWFLGGPWGAVTGAVWAISHNIPPVRSNFDEVKRKLLQQMTINEPVDTMIATFEDEYRPATIQQRKALIRAVRAAAGDPNAFVAIMKQIQPSLETMAPLGDPGEVVPFTYGMGMAPESRPVWPFLLMFFGGTTIGVVAGD